MSTRKNTFLLKRSNVPGKVPSPGDLQLGELALNTADVILYTSGTTANQIVPIGWDRIHRTGDTVTGNFNFNGDIKISGSSLPNDYALSVTGDTNFLGDVYVNGDLFYNGSVIITGSTNIQNGLTANTIYTDYIDFNTTATTAAQVGRLSWDDGDGTLNVTLKGGNVDLQIGQENVVRVFNSELTTLLDGEVVYVSGSQGNRPKVKRAIATSDGYSVTTLGIVTEPIAPGAEGFVTTFGMVNNINTTGTTGGTSVWLSPTVLGGWTTTKPQAPYHTVLLGYIVRVDNNVGSIFTHISNGWELDELHDVRIINATEGDLLLRSSYSGSPVWVNSKTLNGSYTIDGNLTITGDTISKTISATTYYNLPIKVNVDFGFDATYATTSSTFAQIPLNVVVLSANTYNNTYTSMNGTLVCDVSQSDVGITGEFELYNLTDGSSITSSQTSFVNTDDLKSSSSFSIPNTNFDDTLRIRMRRTSGTGSDNVRIRSAQLLLTLI